MQRVVYGFLSLALLFQGLLAFAADPPSPETPFQDHERTLVVDGKPLQYLVHEHVNRYGEREAVIEHVETRSFLPDTNVTVLFARDLDGDGFYDAWFYLSDQGTMASVDLPSTQPDGWDAAEQVLRSHTKLENRWLAVTLLGSLASRISLTEGHRRNLFAKLAQQEIDLLDIEVRAERIRKQNPRAPELLSLYSTLSDGWGDISSQLRVRDQFYWGLADLGVYYSGAVILKGLGFLGKWIGPRVADSEIGLAIQEIYERYAAAAGEKFAAMGEKLGFVKRLTGPVVDAVARPYYFAKLAMKERLEILIGALQARGKIGELLVQGIQKSLEFAPTVTRRVRYVVLTQFAQLSTELWNRRDTLFDANPIILKKKILTDKDLLQNMAYMTVEKAILSNAIPAGEGGGLRNLRNGVLSTVNADSMNYWVRKEHDSDREAIDAGWAAAISNVQAVFDMKTLEYFENMATQSSNGKLKVVGYVVVGLDQIFGYYAYSKVTHWYEHVYKKDGKDAQEELKRQIRFRPILAPTE